MLGTGTNEPLIKSRYIALLFGFLSEAFFFFHRIVVGVTIVSMVKHSALSTVGKSNSQSCISFIANLSYNGSSEQYFKENGVFDWTPELQGYVLGSNYLCYVLSIAPAGHLTERFGCKKILFWAVFLSSVFTFLSPFAAWFNVYVFIAVQCFKGVVQAGFMPAESVLIANWCPKSERGFSFTCILIGSCFGSAVGSYTSGLLCEYQWLRGWPLTYFIFGGAGVITSLLMGCFLHDNPSVHPTISQSELSYITDNQENVLKQKRPKTPWRSLFRSVPVYALACGYFGQVWALTHFLTVQPTFVGTILHYPMERNGLFSALPFLLQLVTGLVGGWLSTYCNDKGYMGTCTARKFWNLVACLGYCGFLVGVYLAGCNRSLSIIFGIASLAMTGFGFAGCWINSADLSPTFAASVNTISSTIGFSAYFILPVVVGYFTNDMETIEQWNKIMLISASVVAISGVVFAVFGSAEVQPWNDVQQNATEKIAEETKL